MTVMKSYRFAALLSCIAVAGMVAACAGGGDDDDDGGSPTGTPICTPIGDTLTDIQATIFTPNCALASCHSTAGAPISNGLDLSSAAMSRAETRNVNAVQLFNNQPVKLVSTSGGASASYLYLKITNANGIQGIRMPQTGAALCQEKLDSVAAWINAGAPAN